MMPRFPRVLLALIIAAAFTTAGLRAEDNELIPSQFSKDQKAKIQSFLEKNAKPDRFLPIDAKLVDTKPESLPKPKDDKPMKKVKQYLVQIVSHRPVPGEEEVKRVDVYYYRPNPEPGQPGITVKHTLDVATGKQVGQTEVYLKRHTPLAREEVLDAVAIAREKSEAVQALYKDHDKVRYEFLQLMVGRKHEPHEPGDRVVSLVFTAAPAKDQPAPKPIRVVVNLTRSAVTAGDK
jgi:hypothetical protein